jgi:thiol:disulfide interchange protein DsbC
MTVLMPFARRAPAVARSSRGGAVPVVLALVAGLAVGAGGMMLAGRAGAPPAAPSASPGGSTPVPASSAAPGEAAIRETLTARIPDLPKIDEVSSTPIAGVYEVRIGGDVIYSDERGAFLLQGSLIDTATRTNLTQERLDKLSAIDFASLPLQDAIVWTQGKGTRKVAVFADPLCGFCKRFEQQLGDAKDVTVYTFLLPILGPESAVKSRNIWCAKDRTAAWRAWMVENKAPADAAASCDTAALERNLALGRKHRVNGTPALVFEDGKRVPGAMPPDALERQLAASTRRS